MRHLAKTQGPLDLASNEGSGTLNPVHIGFREFTPGWFCYFPLFAVMGFKPSV